jgi:hypothetical protein
VVTLFDNDGPMPVMPPTSCACSAGGSLVGQGGDLGSLPSGFLEGPVQAFGGVVKLNTTSLSSSGFGTPWGQSWSWTNDPGSGGGPAGSGSVVSQMPYLLTDSTGTIALVSNGTTGFYFDPDGMGGYNDRFFLQEQLSYDSMAGEFVLIDTAGNTLRFNDFDTGLPAAQRGRLVSLTDPDGTVTEVTSWTTEGQPEEVQRSTTVGTSTLTESYLYEYVASGTNAGLLEQVTLRRRIDSGSWETVQTAEYSYYDTSEDHGNPGDLKTSTVKDASGDPLDVMYYRYYTGEADGYVGGLKYAFGAASYARLDEAFTDPDSATDTEVAAYADVHLEYDAVQRVTSAVVQGAGCSVCSGGLGSYDYEYTTSPFADDYNAWKFKTVETLPDGNQNIAYTNFAGEVMLQVFRDTTTEQEWATFYKYDSAGRVLWTAAPSAVSGYDDSKADLLDEESDNYTYLRDDVGLIQTTSYYSTTTATSTTAGGVAGYVYQTSLQQGETGTAVLQGSTDYIERTAGDVTVYQVASDTVYRNDNGTGGETTGYDYTWFSGTTQMESLTVTAPTVSSGQNGPGTADTTTIFFDSDGRAIWYRDADGFLEYTEYDDATGAVVKTISDVDTTQTSDFSNLPSGWSTPTGGGLHLITTMEVDDQGRTTKETDPNGNITYTVYNDTDYEVRVYRGWDSTTHVPTGPTEVYRQDRAGSYSEMLTMSATPDVDGSGRPTGTEAISDVLTLSRSYSNVAGQVIYSDDYFDLSGLTYSISTTLGTENTNFYRTRYDYTQGGWQNRVELPTGTIERTVYDGLGRVVSTWVGLDDTPTTGYWSPTNTAGTDLVQTSAYEYNNGDVGDGNLTEVTEIPGGADDRVSDYFYDWRDRQVASKSGVESSESTSLNRPIFYTEYDNLSEAIVSEQYDGDNVSIVDANSDGVPDNVSITDASRDIAEFKEAPPDCQRSQMNAP